MSLDSRVPHLRDSRIVAKVGSVRGLCILLAATFAAGVAQAQSVPCGLTSMTETAQLVYPPIAKAAHVEGPVILLATFAQDGTVTTTTTIHGPKMLEAAATTYVKSLRANSYTGPRQCPIVVTFHMQGGPRSCDAPTDQGTYIPRFEHIDLQHVALTVKPACLYSQPAVLSSRN